MGHRFCIMAEEDRKRLEPFAPYLQEAFPELRETKGIMTPGPGEIPASKNFLKFAKQKEIAALSLILGF